MTSTAAKMTEAQVLDLLRKRHVRDGNGGAGEYAFLTHVRNAAGFDATRTFDAIVMNLWPSRGLTLHVYEVKCSRSDWLRELKDPAKAEAAAWVADYFSIVASDSSVVAEAELPPTWGLLVVRGQKLVSVRAAPLLPDADPKRPISRSFLVALLRAGGATPSAEAAEIAEARLEGRREGKESAQGEAERWREAYEELQMRVRAFESAAGVQLKARYGRGEPSEIGRALRTVLEGDVAVKRSVTALQAAQGNLRRAADELDRYIAQGAEA